MILNEKNYKKYFNYVEIDYQQTKDRILNNLKTFLPEYIIDQSENDFGMFLINQIAMLSEIFATYVNIVHNEANPMSAQLMSSILNHIDWYDYEYHLPTGASTYLFLKFNPSINPVIIPKGTKFVGTYLSKEVCFENVENLTINPGEIRYLPTITTNNISAGDTIFTVLSADNYKVKDRIVVENDSENYFEARQIVKIEDNQITVDIPFMNDYNYGSTVSKLVFVRQGQTITEVLGISTGEEDQIYPLKGGQVHITENYDKIINVFAEKNNIKEEYFCVNHLVSKNIDDKSTVFKLHSNRYGNQYIQFGQNGFGKIPPAGSKITAIYLSCDGSLGNVPKGAINKTDNENINYVYNPYDGVNGSDGATLEKIKEDFIAWRKSKKVGFNEDTIIAIARGFPEIKKATCVIDGKIIRLIIVPTYGVLSDELRQRIYKYFNDKILGGYILTIELPTFEGVDIEIKVKVISNADLENIDLLIRNRVFSIFEKLNFDDILFVNDIHNILNEEQTFDSLKTMGVLGFDVTSIKFSDINKENDVIKAGENSLLVLNKCFINFETIYV